VKLFGLCKHKTRITWMTRTTCKRNTSVYFIKSFLGGYEILKTSRNEILNSNRNNNARTVHSATYKNVIVKNTMFPNRNIRKYRVRHRNGRLLESFFETAGMENMLPPAL
jgi:hypothetical protein